MAERAEMPTLLEPDDSRQLEDLLAGPVAERTARTRIEGPIIGTLVALRDGGTVPLVVFDGQPGSAALPARATLDLYARHVGREVVLMFEAGDPQRPLVMGCLHDAHEQSLAVASGRVEVDVDGQRMLVSAKDELVLRCGKASITLTRAGKILIQGTFVSSRSSGVNRLRGASVQIN